MQKTFEKFTINKINISDLANIKTSFTKSNIKTFDIVQINGNLYMTFLNKDIVTYNNGINGIDFIPSDRYNEGIFIRTHEDDCLWLSIEKYDENLQKTNKNTIWDVTNVWRCPDICIFTFWNVKPFKILDLCQETLNKIISQYNYK